MCLLFLTLPNVAALRSTAQDLGPFPYNSTRQGGQQGSHPCESVRRKFKDSVDAAARGKNNRFTGSGTPSTTHRNVQDRHDSVLQISVRRDYKTTIQRSWGLLVCLFSHFQWNGWNSAEVLLVTRAHANTITHRVRWVLRRYKCALNKQ